MKTIIKQKRFWFIISIIYSIMLFLFVIIKIYSPQGSIWFTRNLIIQNRKKGYWNINLVPFKSIISYFDISYGINYKNILANTIPFILLGGILTLAQGNNLKTRKVFLLCTSFILFSETFQFISCFGSFDVDDIIMNILSCIIGMIPCSFYLKTHKLMN